MNTKTKSYIGQPENPENKQFHEYHLSVHELHAPEVVEESSTLTLPYGTMELKQWYFDGIRIKYGNNHYSDHFSFEKKNEMDVVSLGFNLKGKVVISQCGRTYEVGPQQHNIIYTNGFPNTFRNEELHTETFMIEFVPSAFQKIIRESNDILKRFADKMLEGKPLVLSPNNLFINPALRGTIHDVLHCRYAGGLKKLFLLSKSIEILVMQAEAFDKAQRHERNHFKGKADNEKIMYAREYVEEHVDDPPSLSELSRIVGINEYKLKRGFKEMFNTTVFGYLADYRLEIAKHELLGSGKTISEISYELGYSSPQHFSNAFRNKFGVSPSKAKM